MVICHGRIRKQEPKITNPRLGLYSLLPNSFHLVVPEKCPFLKAIFQTTIEVTMEIRAGGFNPSEKY